MCNDGHGCDCENLHLVNCKNGMTIIAIGWTRGNKKALATILPTRYWERLRGLPKFDYYDIAAAHKRTNIQGFRNIKRFTRTSTQTRRLRFGNRSRQQNSIFNYNEGSKAIKRLDWVSVCLLRYDFLHS